MPGLCKVFTVKVFVDKPIFVGQDDIVGRRQLIPILSGELFGEYHGKALHGTVLPGGVDSQVIRPNGTCELSARYAILMDDGASFYIENNGIRTVPPAYVPAVLQGQFIDPDLYYFCTHPYFEVYHPSLNFLKERIYVCAAIRQPDCVLIDYYSVELNET